jgi:thiamine pyrophosphate-dependent acetolactate synthase large subunit-like protein
VGVSLALPGRPVTAMVGDGSAMYGIQALWTAAHLKLPVTYVIANNRSYRILKERLVSMRSTDKFVGMDLRDPAIDFAGLAQSMGVPARRVTDPNDVVPRCARRRARRAGPDRGDGGGRIRRVSGVRAMRCRRRSSPRWCCTRLCC